MDRARIDPLVAKYLEAQRTYRITFSCGLAVALMLLIGFVHLPVFSGGYATGWHAFSPADVVAPDFLQLLPGRETERLHRPAGDEDRSDVEEQMEVSVEPPPGDGGLGRYRGGALPARHTVAHLTPVEGIEPSFVQTSPAMRRMALLETVQLAVLASLPSSEELDNPPELEVNSLRIYYPEEALDRSIEGMVVLHFFVDEEGRPSGINVLKPLHPSCDDAAVKALADARFTPGMRSGQPVAAFTRLGIRFRLH